MRIKEMIPDDWFILLEDETKKEYFKSLEKFVDSEYKETQIYPSKENIFKALELTPYNKLKIIILGQDPYHGEGQAHGLCFSVPDGQKQPPSLKNIYKELSNNLKTTPPLSGNLEHWAKQGALLLNTVLTVRANQANSHKNKGWEIFTDAIISKVNELTHPVCFVLWGSQAQKKIPLINTELHNIIKSVHPSPLSAYRGFLGSNQFSKINEKIISAQMSPIEWIPQTPRQQEFVF